MGCAISTDRIGVTIQVRRGKEITNYPDLSNHHSYMAKCLTYTLYTRLCNLTTSGGVTLDNCIQTGVDNPGHQYIMTVGAVAGDEACYEIFAPLFDKIIYARHDGYGEDQIHKTDLNPENLIGGSNLDSKYVLSCRVRSGRNISGFALPPSCSRAERREVEKIMVDALGSLSDQFSGTYYPLMGMMVETQDKHIEDHLLFDKLVSPIFLASRIVRDWPESRGIWYNKEKNFLIWINEKDHSRIISMEQGGNMRRVFTRFCEGLKKVEEAINYRGNSFMRNEHLGYILTCPSNLGTGLRVGVHLKV